MAFRKSSDPRPQILEVSPAAAIPGGEFQIRGKGLRRRRTRLTSRFGELRRADRDRLGFLRHRARARRRRRRRTGRRQRTATQRSLDLRHRHPDRRRPASRRQSRRRSPRQHLHHLQRIARPEDSRVDLQDRHQPSRQAAGHRPDERHRPGPRCRRRAVRFQPPGRHGLPGVAGRQQSRLRRRHGRRHRHRLRSAKAISTSATAAAPFSRSAASARFTCSRRSNRRIAAYHLAFGPDGYLYVTGPTTSSFDCVHRISHAGHVEVFYRGLGRPQGMAFDAKDNLYVAASLGGRRGVVRITPDAQAELFLSGPAIVGLAFSPSQDP